MKRIILLLFLLLWASNSFSQGTAAELVDSMGPLPCEDLQARLDNFGAKVYEDPHASGFAVLYPGKNPFQNAAYERAIKHNSAFRNFPARLVQPLWAKAGEDLKIEMWKTTGTLPISQEPVSYKILDISTRTRLVETSVEVFKLNGRHFFASDDCIDQFDFSVLAKVLLANPDLSAEVVVWNRSHRKGQAFTRLLRKEAISDNGIPTDKIKITYAGQGIAKEWNSVASAVEIWLFPAKNK